MACLDEDAITDLVAGRLHLNADGLEAHLAGCAACARLLGLASASDSVSTTAVAVPREKSQETVAGTIHRSARAPGLQPGVILNDTYLVGRLIGRGGMGEVYEVRHLRLSGRYAVKVLRAEVSDDAELLSRFRREAEISSSLRHPNIIQVFDFDRTPDGCVYLAMECLEGVDLAGLLRAEGPLDLARAVNLSAQIASALTAAHRSGVVHRDLKPENVFVVHAESELGERVKLMDFGLSKRSGTAMESSLVLSREQALIGTPRYMAPEQALGRAKDVTAAADQFAFAAIFYEMLAGVPAFTGETVAQLLHAIVYEAPRDLITPRGNVPPDAVKAVFKGLAKAPDDRFASVQDFYRAVADAVDGRSGAVAAVAKPRRWWRPLRLGVGIALGVGFVAAAWNGLKVRADRPAVDLSRAALTGATATLPIVPTAAPETVASVPATVSTSPKPPAPKPRRARAPDRPRRGPGDESAGTFWLRRDLTSPHPPDGAAGSPQERSRRGGPGVPDAGTPALPEIELIERL